MNKYGIDINCDLGESYGRFKIGNDDDIFPYITACNIACGFHGGDPLTIDRTIDKAIKHNVKIGAHPSYPDLEGFGRRAMNITNHELFSLIRYQVSALKSMVESKGSKLFHVKPHGALYHTMANNEEACATIIKAINSIDQSLAVVGLANSTVKDVANWLYTPFLAEAFADRRYHKSGQLVDRKNINAVITTPNDAFTHIQTIIKKQQILSIEGESIPVNAQTLCIHGDTANATAIAKAIHNYIQD